MKNETISHNSHGFAAEQPAQHFPHRHGPNIARDASRGKDVKPVHVHGGMTDRQANAMQVGGLGHPVASGGQLGVNPLAKWPLPKNIRPAASSHAGYSPVDVHNHELGFRMMQESTPRRPAVIQADAAHANVREDFERR